MAGWSPGVGTEDQARKQCPHTHGGIASGPGLPFRLPVTNLPYAPDMSVSEPIESPLLARVRRSVIGAFDCVRLGHVPWVGVSRQSVPAVRPCQTPRNGQCLAGPRSLHRRLSTPSWSAAVDQLHDREAEIGATEWRAWVVASMVNSSMSEMVVPSKIPQHS